MAIAYAKGSQCWKNYDICTLGVSLQSANHKGEALEALSHWIGENFNQCIIDLSDTLHRYNFMMDLNISEPEARSQAIIEGSSWIRENNPILARMGIPYIIIRWDQWENHPDFQKNLESFSQAYEQNERFSEAIDADVKSFFIRKAKQETQGTEQIDTKLSSQNFNVISGISKRQMELSRKYLLEELSAHSILYQTHPCATIYPGKQQESFKLVRNGEIDNVPSGLQNSCHTRIVLHSFTGSKHRSAANGNQFSVLPKREVSL